ncbi:hypothetical protein SAMN05444397_101428 [Flavobacterium aquidurense]|uniref:Uncharacterized protein n=1 Tax=Flavobacterium frigidimaris TaxID=262320 RepID=A0ABX4BKW6_FLAFR|nr:hypothetical protein [Flavobacterium frigidimaris]OXA76081.1 hypothetical protein B0A65_19705 [Flavobacterium frigidimaris]SDY35677.1 hypothetical protein SAMN05444397_101428 [Flavobacterium aquidurense]
MKKYASLLLFALLLNGCDDGDLTVDTIDFKEVTSTSCDPITNTLIYKLKPQESLLLNMPADKIINEPTVGDTLVYKIDNVNYRVVYRAYDGTVAKENICGAIPPKTPNVTEEWFASAGTIQIVTKQVEKTPAPTDGHTEITGYNHSIIFKNITFEKPTGPQIEKEYIFGDYLTPVDPVIVSFLEPDNAKYCPDQKKVYNNNTANSLLIENFDAANLFKNEVTPPTQPRRGLINSTATTNNVYYRTYNTTLPIPTTGYYCQEKTPTSPTVKDTWVGETGVTNVSGIIEVTTTLIGTIYTHKIVLKNVTLQKGNSKFKLATEFVLGSVTP